MDSLQEDSTIDDFLNYNSSYINKGDVSISDQLADFERLRISALTKAVEMSPHVKEATIGPNSPVKKEEPQEPKPVKIEEELEEVSLLDDKLREDLRYTLILKKYEAELEKASDRIFKDLIENMIKKHAVITQQGLQKQKEETSKHRIMELRKLRLQKELRANDNLAILESARLDQQKNQILNRQRIENMNRVLEEQNKATARFTAITDSHSKICIFYNEISNTLKTDPYSKYVYNKYVTAVNSVVTNITAIMDLCKTDAPSDKEVKQAEVLALNIENIKIKMTEELNTIKQEEINKKLKEAEMLKQQALEQKKAEEQKAAELAQAQKAAAESKKSPLLFYSTNNYKYYQELQNFLDQYEAQYKDLLENASLKKFRFDCQKAVNTPVNAISSVSGIHIKDKYDKLSKLLKGERVQVLDTYVKASEYPQGLAYCTALLAKKIVRQGDLLVSSKPEAAFPLAAITAALWAQFPEFGKLLEAYFHRLCPYLVPMFLPQKEGQSDKEFYLSRGYTYNDEGVVEKQDKFLKRMSGIFRLRCAIWITKAPEMVNAPNPPKFQCGWQWLASFINLKPEPDICATLLHDFFSVCGSEFLKCYGRQFTKIIKLISTDYLAVLQNIDEGGPKTRLEVFLQDVLKTGYIPPPTGLVDPNAWCPKTFF